MKSVIKMEFRKETKNTFVFNEVLEENELIVPTLYIKKDAFFDEKRPESIRVTIESEDSNPAKED